MKAKLLKKLATLTVVAVVSVFASACSSVCKTNECAKSNECAVAVCAAKCQCNPCVEGCKCGCNMQKQCAKKCACNPCVKGCIAGALSVKDGVIVCDESRCVGCYTCVLSCPYGAVVIDGEGHKIRKCDLCLSNSNGAPACVQGCPNNAIVFEER